MVTITDLFSPAHSIMGDYLKEFVFPWEALAALGTAIRKQGDRLPAEQFERWAEDIWVAKTAKVAKTASLTGPCIVDDGAEIRHGAFIRGNAVVGKGAVVGNSTELKNCILFDGVQVPHYNYVGDSILGYRAHLGAGAVTSNVKSDRTPVTAAGRYPTGRQKCGAMLGDHVEVGCNAVLNPGTVVGRYSRIYPTACVRGFVPPRHIYKDADHILPQRED